ncbi:MAG: type III pantothenate kinase [Thermoleophilaceae bacterium]
MFLTDGILERNGELDIKPALIAATGLHAREAVQQLTSARVAGAGGRRLTLKYHRRMLLAIDVGNTQTHIGMFRDGGLVEHWRFATVREATGDELATVLVSLLALRSLTLRDIDGAIVSSVVPQLAHEYQHVSERYLSNALLVIGPGIRTGIPIRTENPHEVGADRLVNAVAAFDRIGAACIVVDFGTAITYDVVSAEGELLGAIITPGIEISMEALSERAAKLPKVELEEPRELIGRSTPAAIQSGVIYGFAGQVDGIVARVREEIGADAVTIATGGLAASITPFCSEIDETDELLTLTGLRLIWERNTG